LSELVPVQFRYEYQQGTNLAKATLGVLRLEGTMKDGGTPRSGGFLVCSVLYALPSHATPMALEEIGL